MKNLCDVFGVTKEWANGRRIEYLTDKCAELKTEIDFARIEFKQDIANGVSVMDRLFKWYMADIPLLEKQLKRYGDELLFRLKGGDFDNDLDKATIDKAREIPIEDVYPELKGKFIKCLNPDHGDNRPSMYIKGFAYCFSCGKRYNVIDFVMLKEELSFNNAVARIMGDGYGHMG